MKLTAALAFSLALPAAVGAQLAGPYRLELGDTLRYHEVTSSTVEIQTPQGAMTANTDHDATIALAADGPGSVAAWYEALSIGLEGGGVDQRPATDAMLGVPFRLAVTGSGGVETVDAPPSPADVQAVTDLSQQFFDFLITVPPERPVPGDTWADTLRTDESAVPETTQTVQAIRTYTAAGDTVVGGTSALLIRTRTEVQIESTSPMAGQPVTVTTVLEGTETGAVAFDWERGRMLVRLRDAELRGVLRLNGPQPIELPQGMAYTSRIEGR